MRYIIWGTGFYSKSKIEGIRKEDIVAFVERYKTSFQNRETILPEEIMNVPFDKIIILSSYYLEIIPELISMGIPTEKIVPGIMVKPYMFDELELMSNNSIISVNEDGSLLYIYDDHNRLTISCKEDWEKVRKYTCCEENSNIVKKMKVVPVGKQYGVPRGGSICRFYIDSFLNKYRQYISGNVLEVGDREYTIKYMDDYVKSYVMHFDTCYADTEYDFSGDLRNGRGLKKNFYNCIILTQVLNFVSDLRMIPKILVDSLRPNGVILLTVSGITPICRYDMDRYGQFWGFTDAGIKEMFSTENVECITETYGNFKVACASLAGMSFTELDKKDLLYCDEDFQVFISAIVRKK